MGSKKPHIKEQVKVFNIDSPLLKYQKNITSQCGEDGIIEKIFEIVEPLSKVCVEFGAWDGKLFSNCNNLVTNLDWKGFFIEGDKDKYSDLVKTYKNFKKTICINNWVEFSGNNSLDNILNSYDCPKEFDLLSIDVDGIDYFIWENLSMFEPRVIVIEFNPTIPNDVVFVQAKDSSVNQGCSLHALIILGKEKGYELICATNWNAIFVKAELYEKFNIRSNHIYSLYKPLLDGRIFHGYDNEIHVIGMDIFLWSGVQINSDDFQVLPKSLRNFGKNEKRN